MKILDIDNAKSYASEKNLVKALDKWGITDAFRFMVVCNTAGRFTAIFPLTNTPGIDNLFPMRVGFPVIGG